MEAVLWFDKRMTPLEAALEAFGRTRSSQITPLILELGRAEPFTPPQARKNFDFHRAWLAAVSAPAARTWAMSTLSAQLPKLADGKEAHFGDQSDALEERLRALLVLAPDPRISSAVLALAELNPPVVGFVDVMIAMAESLAHHADDATRDAIPPDQASNEEIARAQALAKQHGKGWLGKLRPITARAEFRRGFLWRLELAGSWSSKAWAELARDPSLATVEELRRGQAVTKLVAPFLLSGVMQSLRTVPLDDAVMLDAVKRSALPKLEELTSVDDEDPEVLAYLEKNPRIISLEWSNLNVAGSIKRWPASVRARLQRLTAADPITKAKVIWPLLPKLKALSLGFSLPITLRRGDEKNAWLVAEGVIYSDLKGLPKTVKTVELTGNAALAKRFEKAYPRLTIVSKPTPSGLITNPKG